MLEKHLKDLFTAIIHCYQNQLLMPCLVLFYAGIDVAAFLSHRWPKVWESALKSG